MINCVSEYRDLRSLNNYLEKNLDFPLYPKKRDVIERLNTIIKEIQKNRACFSDKGNTTGDYVSFLSSYLHIQKLSVECGEDEQKVPTALKKAVRLARDHVIQSYAADQNVMSSLHTAYPPAPIENEPLYPIQSMVDAEEVLHIVMIPTMPRDYPDTVLELLVKTKCKEVSISYYGGPVEGGEDRKKQFFADLMQGLIHSSQKIKFQKTFSGKLVPSTKVLNIVSQAEYLGTVLGLALRSGCPIGEVFGLEFFHSLRSFAKTASFTWYVAGIEAMKTTDHKSLLTYMKTLAIPIPEVKDLEKVLKAKKADDVKAAAITLNRKWHHNRLEAAIEIGDSEKIKGCVSHIWITGFQETMEAARFVGETMVEYQPFTITTLDGNKHQIRCWIDLATVSTEEFAMQLQGKVTMAKIILRSRSCREFVEDNSACFLKDPELLPLMLAAHPPGKQNNLCFYPIEANQRSIEVAMIPTMPLVYPDEVLENLTYICRDDLRIKYYGSGVIDRGAPMNQVFSDLMQGLIQVSTRYRFEKTESGKLIPIATWSHLKTNDNHWKRLYYVRLGNVLGLALRIGSRIGDVFCKEFIHCLRTFSTADLNHSSLSSSLFFIKKSDADLIAYMKDSVPPTESMKLVERVLLSENEKDARAAAKELNDGWSDDKLTAVLEKGDLKKIQSNVRANWLAGYKAYFRAAHVIAQGMEGYLPFKFQIDNLTTRVIKKWNDLATVSTEVFAMQLQG